MARLDRDEPKREPHVGCRFPLQVATCFHEWPVLSWRMKRKTPACQHGRSGVAGFFRKNIVVRYTYRRHDRPATPFDIRTPAKAGVRQAGSWRGVLAITLTQSTPAQCVGASDLSHLVFGEAQRQSNHALPVLARHGAWLRLRRPRRTEPRYGELRRRQSIPRGCSCSFIEPATGSGASRRAFDDRPSRRDRAGG